MKRHKISKRFIAALLLGAVLAMAGAVYVIHQYTTLPFLLHNSSETAPTFRCNEKRIEHNENGVWKEFKTAGVTVSPSLPGGKSVSYAQYLAWFADIAAMNANVLEASEQMNPDFYKAFYDYNTAAETPLYLLQSIRLPKKTYADMMDAVTGKLEQALTKAACETINRLHGLGGRTRTPDVSPWVMGYLVGDEWDSELVLYTNDIQREYAGFEGRYCSTWESASAFESVLARVGDNIFAYETGKFKTQKLLAFRNGAFTDPLIHDTAFSPGLYENLAHVNTQLISTSEQVKSGFFAAYDLRPYEAQFLSFDPIYTQGRNKKGQPDAFYTYLTALNAYHEYAPVLLTSFGLPTARGCAGLDEISGRNGGNLSENQQGKMLSELFTDIMDAGFAGGCLAAWQDDWSADTWNCHRVCAQDGLGHWKDVQSANQNMGILAVEPGAESAASYPDGDFSEWTNVAPLLQKDGITVQTLFDEAYLYFRIHVPDFSQNQEVILPIDITPHTGASIDKTNDMAYDTKADFALVIQGTDNAALLVQKRYDAYYALHHLEESKEDVYFKKTMPAADSGEFTVVRQYVRKSRHNAQGVFQPPTALETGKLHFGNANPASAAFDSLADFYCKGEDIEVRIPWALLNFADPSAGKILGDFYTDYGVSFCDLTTLSVGLVWKADENVTALPSKAIALPKWNAQPTFHFRKKAAYTFLQRTFALYQNQP
ncbi:MAG: hypothetical protein RSF84_01115 [Ruthenibacterium sp.]